MRIYEQELYKIRLTLQLHEAKENKEEEFVLREQKTELEEKLKTTENQITNFVWDL